MVVENGLSENQFGFRKGKSTVDAIQAVVDIATKQRRGTGKRKGFCALISIDIRNAFNTAMWNSCIKAIVKKSNFDGQSIMKNYALAYRKFLRVKRRLHTLRATLSRLVRTSFYRIRPFNYTNVLICILIGKIYHRLWEKWRLKYCRAPRKFIKINISDMISSNENRNKLIQK